MPSCPQCKAQVTGNARFCPGCGTPLTYRLQDRNEVDVTLGSLDDPNAVWPADHTWTKAQLDWVKLVDGLPRNSRSRGNGAG